jgi:hypothetical protein
MLVSHRKQFIYTKTIKTAGTSIEIYFEPYCLPEGQWDCSHIREQFVGDTGIIGYRGGDITGKKWYNHMPAEKIKQQLGQTIWDRYLKFCVIRNPFDKIVSAYVWFEHQMKENPTFNFEVLKQLNFICPMDNVVGSNIIERFRDWIAKGGFVDDRDKYMIDNKICVDFFIRYENLTADLRSVCNRLNISYEHTRIPKLKSGIRSAKYKLADYYDRKTIELVEERYQDDIHRFGYTLPLHNL